MRQSKAENEYLQGDIAGLHAQYEDIKENLTQLQATDSAHQREIQELNKQLEDAKSYSRHVLRASGEVINAFFYWRCGDQVTQQMRNLVQ